MATETTRRERMQKLVERWRSSGESMAAFARRHGIDPQKLAYWRRLLGKGETRKRGDGPAEGRPGFVPVRVVGEGEGVGGAVEIVLGADCRVLVREGVSRELLGDVIAALRQSC